MPIFHRNFLSKGDFNPKHLERVGPRLRVQIGVPDALAALYTQKDQAIPSSDLGFALFDTGASMTCVDEGILVEMGLHPVRVQRVSTPSGDSELNCYPCRLSFPGCPLPDIDPSIVVGAKLQKQGYAALIGRDLLRDMILIYDGPGARVTFAF